jgi:exosome complex component RRP46
MSRPLLASRPLTLSLAPLPHADGSAIFASGPLSVLAALAGPSEVRIRDELSDAATLVVLHTPLLAPAALPSTALGAALHAALAAVVRRELLPRTLLQLSVHALSLPPPPPLSASRPPRHAPPLPPSHPDARIQAPEVAACLNAAMLALLDAGTECTATLAAACVAVLPAAKARSLRAAKHWRAGEEDQAEDEEMEDEER